MHRKGIIQNMNKKIGAFIQQLRKENNFTQEQLAEKLGVSNRSVSRWENGTTMPDITLMKCICDEFDISISELINGERQNSLPNKKNVEEKATLKTKEIVNIILELSKHESKQKTKAVTFYFSLGFLFLGIILLQTLLFTFDVIRTPFLNKIQTLVFFLIVLIAEFAGFYFNNKHKEFTPEELNFLLQDEKNIQLKTSDDMVQFARKNQPNILKQHKQAFKEIASNLENDEHAVFTMLADEYSINNAPGPWHVAVAVTNKRFFVSGETIRGRMFTHYDTDCWMLNEIKSINLENRNIIITTTKDKLNLKGKKIERYVCKLKKYAP